MNMQNQQRDMAKKNDAFQTISATERLASLTGIPRPAR
jgi:hypothetical protein